MPTRAIRSSNGYPVLDGDDERLHTWVIPTREGLVEIKLRRGATGFILAHFILWFADVIEPIKGKILDDWGWAPFRLIRGSATFVSNHCSGTAFDLNAMQHVLAARGTFGIRQYVLIRLRLKLYRGCIRHGIDYVNRADEMHGEIDKDLVTCKRVAKRLLRTPRGKRLMKWNEGQRKVILA